MFYAILAVLVLVSIVVTGLCLPFFLQRLGEANLFFTTVGEGKVKTIMRGKALERFIMTFAGYHLNDPSKPWYRPIHPDWEVLYHGKDNPNGFTGVETKDEHYDDRLLPFEKLGLHWIGWPWAHSIYVYAFEWNETKTGKSGKEEILPRAEASDFIYVADFTYAIKTDSAETKDRLPTDELTLVTLAIRNPYRALFSGEDWIRRVTAAVNRLVRDFVGQHDFKPLISSPLTDFSSKIVDLSRKLPDDKEKEGSPGVLEEPHGLKQRYGVEVRTADLQTIELSGGAQELSQKATLRQYVADQEALAKKAEGQAEADVILMKGTKEAAALAARLAVIKDYGDAGITLAGYDAIQESSKGPGNTIIWANNPLGALAGMLKPEAKGDKT